MTVLGDTHLRDVGLHNDAFYETHLPAPVYALRKLLRPLLDRELPLITALQNAVSACNLPFITTYFLYTANLGSHLFYVLVLPLPAWLGALHLTRDVVFVLGLGIYLTGLFKDLLSLPRPPSPPTVRYTMSSYTSSEYGCPSSHAANATALITILALYHTDSNFYPLHILYWTTIVFGRVLCGMHGIVDVSIGAIIGLLTVLIRSATRSIHDSLVLTSTSPLVPISLLALYYSLIYFHPIPLEGCPCFEDSVAFIAVLAGLDLAYWTISYSSSVTSPLLSNHPARIPYSFEIQGISGTLIRLVVGVALVVLWRTIAKPIATTIISTLRRENPALQTPTPHCYAELPRTDTRVFVKFVVYAGIPLVVLYSTLIFNPLSI